MPKDHYDGQCPTTAVERLVTAPPARVWPLLVDPELPARSSAELQAGEWRRDQLIARRLDDLRRNTQAVVDGVADLIAEDGAGRTTAGR